MHISLSHVQFLLILAIRQTLPQYIAQHANYRPEVAQVKNEDYDSDLYNNAF